MLLPAVENLDSKEAFLWEFLPIIQVSHQLLVALFCGLKFNIRIFAAVFDAEECRGEFDLECEN